VKLIVTCHLIMLEAISISRYAHMCIDMSYSYCLRAVILKATGNVFFKMVRASCFLSVGHMSDCLPFDFYVTSLEKLFTLVLL